MGMYENIESLDKELGRLTTKLSNLEPESEAYKAVRVSLDTLYKVRNDVYKVDTEDIAARDKSDVDVKQKEAELEIRKQELESANTKIENERKQKEDELKSANDRFTREMEMRGAELEARKLELESANTKIENERKSKEDELKSANERFAQEMRIREAELEARKQELESAERQHKDDIKSQRFNRVRDYVVTGITSVVKIGTTLLAAYLTFEVAKKGYQFEKDGCPTSKTFRDEMKNSIDLFKDLAKSK
ncbi:MAG: hypothetical protein J6U54_10065 [Clostridiales bacterium]|nr:hypothetical protein [Clostridiales bacterium]